MDIYKTPSKEIQEIILANVTYETVIDGLNKYFASKPRNEYITVKMESDKQDFALYEAEAWADILISWLRTEHDIFYYPGMEAKHAKMERIPPLTELMIADYEKDLLKFIYEQYKSRTRLSDETITYDPQNVRNTIVKIISDYARCRTRDDILEAQIKFIFDKYKTEFTIDDYVLNGDPTSKFMLDCISSWMTSPAESRGKTRAEIENYKLKLKNYILKDIGEHGYRYDGLETKSVEEIVAFIIAMATCPRNEWAKDEIENLRGQIKRLKDLINAMNEEVKDM